MNQPTEFISNSQQYQQTANLEARLDKILSYLKTEHGLRIDSQLSSSDYYGTGKVGAVHFIADHQGRTCVLKIQGAKPNKSEADIINHFQNQNKSQLIRPPVIHFTTGWQPSLHFEAIIMEYIQGEPVLIPGELHSVEEVASFFEVYQEYRRRCVNRPWLSQPKRDAAAVIADKYQRLQQAASDVKPDSPYRSSQDQTIINQALAALNQFYRDVPLEFQHGHFSVHDLLKINENEIVLLSNLFWKWANPYYDAVFAYHWFIYSLASTADISAVQVKTQRKIWLDQIYQLAVDRHQERLITAALLERAVAGLLIDAFAYIDQEAPLAEYMAVSTRRQVLELTDQLS